MAQKPVASKAKANKKKPSKKRRTKAEKPAVVVKCTIEVEIYEDSLDTVMSKIAQSDVPDTMLALLTALRATATGGVS